MIKFWTRNYKDYEIMDEALKPIDLKAPIVVHDASPENLAEFFSNSYTVNGLNVNDVIFTLMVTKRNENKI